VWEGVNASTEARQFCDLWGIPPTVLVDENGDLARRLGIRGVPANVFVDANGTVIGVGASTPDDLEALTARLLGSRALIDPA
jgi:hypothetical protein